MEPDFYTITKADLVKALETWDREAKANGWPARTDLYRWVDTADYLLRLIAGPENSE